MSERDRKSDRRPRFGPRDLLGRPLPAGQPDELGESAPDPALTIAETAERARHLFDEQRFFEAHEGYEALWKRADVAASDRDFWRGLAQVAVGWCHRQRGNPRGAVSLLTRGASLLRRYPEVHHGIRAGEVWRLALASAVAIESGDAEHVEYPKLAVEHREE